MNTACVKSDCIMDTGKTISEIHAGYQEPYSGKDPTIPVTGPQPYAGPDVTKPPPGILDAERSTFALNDTPAPYKGPDPTKLTPRYRPPAVAQPTSLDNRSDIKTSNYLKAPPQAPPPPKSPLLKHLPPRPPIDQVDFKGQIFKKHKNLKPIVIPKWWQRKRTWGIGCGVLIVVTTIVAIIIWQVLKNKENPSHDVLLGGLNNWLPVWKVDDAPPAYCVTPNNNEYKEIRCHGMSTQPDFKDPIVVMHTAYMYGNSWPILDAVKFSQFPSLRFLELQNNRIKQVDLAIFKGLSELRSLNLSQNKIASFKKQAFPDLSNLRKLKLGNNAITNLDPGTFRSLTNLVLLCLSNNRIQSLHEQTFQGLQKLKEIRLNHNSITRIRSGLFKGLAALQTIHLEHNQITAVDDKTFQEVNFREKKGQLFLQSNHITKIEAGAFSSSASLQDLDLRLNPFDCNQVGYLPTDVSGLRIPERCGGEDESCDEIECRTNEECLIVNNLAECLCLPGYIGPPCVDFDECNQQPCLRPRASCENSIGSYTCVCDGNACENALITPSSHPTRRRKPIHIILSMLAIAIVLFISYRLSRLVVRPAKNRAGARGTRITFK